MLGGRGQLVLGVLAVPEIHVDHRCVQSLHSTLKEEFSGSLVTVLDHLLVFLSSCQRCRFLGERKGKQTMRLGVLQ